MTEFGEANTTVCPPNAAASAADCEAVGMALAGRAAHQESVLRRWEALLEDLHEPEALGALPRLMRGYLGVPDSMVVGEPGAPGKARHRDRRPRARFVAFERSSRSSHGCLVSARRQAVEPPGLLWACTTSYTRCMKSCMRTNVVLNDELVEEAMKYSTARSRSALLEEALRVFVQSRAAERKRASYERRVLELRQRLAGVAPRESALDVVRRDRERG